MSKNNFTERQERLLDTCKNAGFGWREFALSVRAQGFCSHKQEETLVNMHQKIEHARCVKAGHFKNNSGCWDSDISDMEAYRSGDFF